MQLFENRLFLESSDTENIIRFFFEPNSFSPALKNALFPNESLEDAKERLKLQWGGPIFRRFASFSDTLKSDSSITFAFKIFEYLWGQGSNPAEHSFFKWVPLNQMSKDLVSHRLNGRPSNKGDRIDEKPIRHYTTFIRILKKMVDAELIECKKKIIPNDHKPTKSKQNSFYRISNEVLDGAVTQDEKIRLLRNELKMYEDSIWKLMDQFTALTKILKERGIPEPTLEERDAWLAVHYPYRYQQKN